ncbi:hypothetical protein D3C76_1729360 [compost metagenome]
MAANHPILGAQVIEVHPQRRFFPLGHGFHVSTGQLTSEGGDHHVCGFGRLPRGRPLTDLDMFLPLLHGVDVDRRAQTLERTQIIDP